MKILFFLKVEADPEFCLHIAIGFVAERLGNIWNFEPFHKFEVNRNAKEKELESVAKRSNSIRFAKDSKEPGFIESIKSIEFRCITLDFGTSDVKE